MIMYVKASQQPGSASPPPPDSMAPLMKSSSQQHPPTSGSRQLSKLKRFLTTLQAFGSDISPQIGDRVRALVLGLVNSHLSIEDFHSKLQQTTNFPLRPFVIPFLKANLPLLQRELLYCARLAKQSPQQFLTQNEHMMFNPAHSPLGLHESIVSQVNENGKRRFSDSNIGPHENRTDLEAQITAKRHHGNRGSSPACKSSISPGPAFSVAAGTSLRLEDISKSRDSRDMDRLERERAETETDREKHYSDYSFRQMEAFDHCELSADWQHVETMLGCILNMVDKTKRALSVLRDRSLQDREDLSLWSQQQLHGLGSDPVVRALRHTGDALSDVRRRADEVVTDVRRQAMLELRRAVSCADQKAADLVMAETLRMERAVADVRAQVHTKLLLPGHPQEESAESCWNCGRRASETCSGCSMARYCGSFCQHKDWDNHHHVCGRAYITSSEQLRTMPRTTTTKVSMAALLGSGMTVQETSSTKESPTLDHSSDSCPSPQSSAVPCMSARDDPLTTAAPATVTSTQRSMSTSPITASPASSDPDVSATDADTGITSPTLTENSAA
ncbi:hypothetical protein BsWGS_22185 [Bradybaena similaris]